MSRVVRMTVAACAGALPSRSLMGQQSRGMTTWTPMALGSSVPTVGKVPTRGSVRPASNAELAALVTTGHRVGRSVDLAVPPRQGISEAQRAGWASLMIQAAIEPTDRPPMAAGRAASAPTAGRRPASPRGSPRARGRRAARVLARVGEATRRSRGGSAPRCLRSNCRARSRHGGCVMSFDHLDDPNPPPRPSDLVVARIMAEGDRRLRHRRYAGTGAAALALVLGAAGLIRRPPAAAGRWRQV
jgi:hypothetical protein